MIPTDQVSPALAEEFTATVQWLGEHGRPELTPALAVVEAVEDWIALVRTEHLRGDEIPRADPLRPPAPE